MEGEINIDFLTNTAGAGERSNKSSKGKRTKKDKSNKNLPQILINKIPIDKKEK